MQTFINQINIKLLQSQQSLFVAEITLFTLAIPFLLFPGRVVFIGLILIIFQIFLRRIRTQHWFPESSLTNVIMILLGMVLISVLVSPALSLSLNRFWLVLLGMATFFTTLDFAKSEAKAITLGIVLCVVATIVAVLSLVVTDWSGAVLVEQTAPAASLPFLLRLPGSGVPTPLQGVNPREVAGSIVLLLPLPLCLALFGQGKRLRWLGLLTSLVLAIPLVLSQSPQGVLSLALAGTVVVAWKKPKALVVVFILFIVVAVTWLKWRWWLPEMLVERLELGISARLEIWPRAWMMIRDMPFSGGGLNAYPVLDELYSLIPTGNPHAHNLFLQTGVDLGILGLIVIFVIFGRAWLAGKRSYDWSIDANFRAVLLGCAAGTVAFLGFGLWDVASIGHKPAPALWAMLGILAASEKITSLEYEPLLSPTVRRRLSIGLVIAALISLPLWTSAFAVNLARLTWNRSIVSEGAIAPGNLAKVEGFANAAVELYPGNSRGHLMLGISANQKEDYQAAVTHLEKAVQIDRLDPLGHFELGDSLFQVGEKSRATNHYRVANAEEALFQRATGLRREGLDSEAISWFKIITELVPENRQAWLSLAGAQAAAGNPSNAAEIYSETIERFPKDSRGYSGLSAVLYTQLSNSRKARQVIEDGFSNAENDDPDLYYWRSRLAADRKDYKAAEEDIIKAINIFSSNLNYHLWLGDIYTNQEKFDNAVHQYELIITDFVDPMGILKARQRLARAFTKQQLWKGAIAEWEEVIRINLEISSPSSETAGNYISLGDVLSEAGEITRASGAYNKALEFDPDNDIAHARLAAILNR